MIFYFTTKKYDSKVIPLEISQFEDNIIEKINTINLFFLFFRTQCLYKCS